MPYERFAIQTCTYNTVGLFVFMELHKRVFGSRFGKMPAALKDDAFGMRGYCIDAPDTLPAGSCISEQITADEWCPTQSEIPR